MIFWINGDLYPVITTIVSLPSNFEHKWTFIWKISVVQIWVQNELLVKSSSFISWTSIIWKGWNLSLFKSDESSIWIHLNPQKRFWLIVSCSFAKIPKLPLQQLRYEKQFIHVSYFKLNPSQQICLSFFLTYWWFIFLSE